MSAEHFSIYPLDEFYERTGHPLPPLRFLPVEALPQPQRRLLVHEDDMTPTVEAFYGQLMHLRVIRRIRQPDSLLREVVLESENGVRAVFGAIRINLCHFSPVVQEEILQCRVPLGSILQRHRVPHHSQPQAFFCITPDVLISRALGLVAPPPLYGRVSRLLNSGDDPLVQVVEILPPAPPKK